MKQATQKRLELSTSAVTGRRSNQLSHWAIMKVLHFQNYIHVDIWNHLTMLPLECGHLMTPSFGAFCFANVQSS